MGDKINSLDKLFKSALAKHTVTTDPEVWGKLSNRLDNNEKAGVFIWWRWVAVAAIGIFSFWLIYQPLHQESKNLASVAVIDTKISGKTPIDLSPSLTDIGKEKVDIKTPDEASTAGFEKTVPLKSNLSNESEAVDNINQVKNESLTGKKRIKTPLPIAMNETIDIKKDALADPFNDKIHLNPKIGLTVKDNPNNEYKVKIISNGYAIQPEKEKLVEELENKIGGFFTKVDEGFGDLQDAKNNLFAALTTTRDKRKKQTN